MLILADPNGLPEARRRYGELRAFIDDSETLVGDYWADLVSAEAHFVLGDFRKASKRAEDAIRNGASPAAAQSTAEQVRALGDAGVHPRQAIDFERWLLQATRARVRGGTTPIEPFAPLHRPHLIFHISDVHFGPSGLKDDAPMSMHRFHPDQNTLPLHETLAEEFRAAIKREECLPEDTTIVVSGDMAYTGQPDEFVMVHDFLTELCKGIGMSPSQVVLVPGNHDVDWTAPKHDLGKRFDNYLSFARKFYGKDHFSELFPLITWNFEIGDKRPEPNQLIYFNKQGPYTFVGLNSCIFEDDQNHYGFIGLRQLNAVQHRLRESRGEEYDNEGDSIRVAVMHHHLHPYPEALTSARDPSKILTDLSTVRDAGIVEQRLSRMGFSLLLHGHKHKPQLRETSVLNRDESTAHAGRSLIVSGCGSTGVAEKGLEHNQSNHFAIIKLLRGRRESGVDFVQVEWREMALQAGAEWVSSARWVLKG